MAKVDMTGLNRLVSKLNKVVYMSPGPLMESLSKIITDGNRRGILAAEDKDGAYMPAVTYRPKGVGLSAKSIRGQKGKDLRNGQKGSQKGVFAGFGPMAAGLHNNLSRKEYESLNGPPLAPRGAFSRVITNFVTGFYSDVSNRVWTVVAGWRDVVDSKGREFLQAHFDGEGNLPIRNIAGIRPEDMKKCRNAFINWARDQIRSDLK